jgi:hypothetical protein
MDEEKNYEQPEAKEDSGVLGRLKHSFFASDMNNIGDYLLKKVVIPSAQDLASNLVDGLFKTATTMKDILIYGEEGRPSSGRRDYASAFRNPNARSTLITSKSSPSNTYQNYMRAGGRYNFDYIEFEDLYAAKEVLDKLSDILENYPCVSVSDFLEAANRSSQPVDQNWGWLSLNKAEPKRNMNGHWVLKMPPVQYLK